MDEPTCFCIFSLSDTLLLAVLARACITLSAVALPSLNGSSMMSVRKSCSIYRTSVFLKYGQESGSALQVALSLKQISPTAYEQLIENMCGQCSQAIVVDHISAIRSIFPWFCWLCVTLATPLFLLILVPMVWHLIRQYIKTVCSLKRCRKILRKSQMTGQHH